jgi:hypothetical protein
LNLFARKDYQLALYRELFPADTMITEDDIEMVALEHVLTIHPFNGLGLLARGEAHCVGRGTVNLEPEYHFPFGELLF